MGLKEPAHPTYEYKNVRAVFRPTKQPDEPSLQAMAGHEFVWAYVGLSESGRHIWTPANPKDIEDYFEVVDQPNPDLVALLVAESELDIFRVEKLDA